MEEIRINGLRIRYERERSLFNYLLKMNGVSKKQFAEKFGLSYSYVNTWGSTTKEGPVKFPSWVFVYLKDVIYYKVAAIRLRMSLSRLYDELEAGRNLTEIYREFQKTADGESAIEIPPEMLAEEKERAIVLDRV